MKAKLSEIWAWAEANLTQIRQNWSDSPRTACALGAIEMFRTNRQRAIPNWGEWKKESYLTALRQFIGAVKPDEMGHERSDDPDISFDIYVQNNVYLITGLNDHEEWTFAMLSKKAKELEEAGVIT